MVFSSGSNRSNATAVTSVLATPQSFPVVSRVTTNHKEKHEAGSFSLTKKTRKPTVASSSAKKKKGKKKQKAKKSKKSSKTASSSTMIREGWHAAVQGAHLLFSSLDKKSSMTVVGEIICGRSCGLNANRPSNLYFRFLLFHLRDLYDNADDGHNHSSRGALKRTICELILEYLWSKGARFVEPCKHAATAMEELSRERCLYKIGQTFRDLRGTVSQVFLEALPPSPCTTSVVLRQRILDVIHTQPDLLSAAEPTARPRTSTSTAASYTTSDHLFLALPKGDRISPRLRSKYCDTSALNNNNNDDDVKGQANRLRAANQTRNKQGRYISSPLTLPKHLTTEACRPTRARTTTTTTSRSRSSRGLDRVASSTPSSSSRRVSLDLAPPAGEASHASVATKDAGASLVVADGSSKTNSARRVSLEPPKAWEASTPLPSYTNGAPAADGLARRSTNMVTPASGAAVGYVSASPRVGTILAPPASSSHQDDTRKQASSSIVSTSTRTRRRKSSLLPTTIAQPVPKKKKNHDPLLEARRWLWQGGSLRPKKEEAAPDGTPTNQVVTPAPPTSHQGPALLEVEQSKTLPRSPPFHQATAPPTPSDARNQEWWATDPMLPFFETNQSWPGISPIKPLGFRPNAHSPIVVQNPTMFSSPTPPPHFGRAIHLDFSPRGQGPAVPATNNQRTSPSSNLDGTVFNAFWDPRRAPDSSGMQDEEISSLICNVFDSKEEEAPGASQVSMDTTTTTTTSSTVASYSYPFDQTTSSKGHHHNPAEYGYDAMNHHSSLPRML